jgi:hypothetical protein
MVNYGESSLLRTPFHSKRRNRGVGGEERVFVVRVSTIVIQAHKYSRMQSLCNAYSALRPSTACFSDTTTRSPMRSEGSSYLGGLDDTIDMNGGRVGRHNRDEWW